MWVDKSPSLAIVMVGPTVGFTHVVYTSIYQLYVCLSGNYFPSFRIGIFITRNSSAVGGPQINNTWYKIYASQNSFDVQQTNHGLSVGQLLQFIFLFFKICMIFPFIQTSRDSAKRLRLQLAVCK